MRILLTYFTFPPAANGISSFLGEVSSALVKKGHEVEIICGGVEKKKIEKIGKLRIYRLPFYNRLNKESPEIISKKFLKQLIFIHKRKPLDIIEAEPLITLDGTPYGLALNIFSLLYNVPVVLRYHGMKIDDYPASMIKSLFWRKIFCVCNKGKEAIYNRGVEIEKLETQNNAINIDNFKPGLGKKWLRTRIGVSDDDFLIGIASRIINPGLLSSGEEDPVLKEKGIIDLLQAFANSLKDKKNAKLIIAAAPPPFDLKERWEKVKLKIEELAKVLGVEKKVTVHAFAMDEMPHFYNGLDLFVLPSHSEAYPMVIIEAMACKVPVVATSVGGIPEIIANGETGFLVPVEDSVELGKTLRDLIKSVKRRNNVAIAGYNKIQKENDMMKKIDKIIGGYQSVLNNKQKSKKIDNASCGDSSIFN